MKRLLFSVLSLITALSVSAQESQEVLMTINDHPVYVDEFLAVYNKNRDVGKDIDPKTPEEYLELYINYKLKVEEAMALGYDTMPSFQREFANYRSQIAKPYLTDKREKEVVMEEAYERMKYDVRASHIMKDLSNTAKPEDTLRVYNEMLALRQSIIDGKTTFEKVAEEVSTDTYSKVRGGDLGYFTVFNMVYPFETAAYETEVGEISMPIRTQYGYHIVKTTDKRPSKGKIKISHILISEKPKTNIELQKEKKSQIEEIYSQLEAGSDFAELAKKYSEDKTSAANGGELIPIGTGDMIDEFEEVAFSLKNPGEYSKPFKTRMGWHIVKLDAVLGVPTFEEAKADIEKKMKGDDRELRTQKSFIAKLKKEYDFSVNERNYKKLLKKIDNSYLNADWDPAEALKMDKELFEANDTEFTQGEFAKYLNRYQRRVTKPVTVDVVVKDHFNNYVDKILIDIEDKNLANKYPEFRYLVNEYRDGILLFDLTDKMVWTKAMEDTTGLEEYFKAHQSEFQWEKRVDVIIFKAKDEKLAKKVVKGLKKGEDPTKLNSSLNNNNALNLKLDSALVSKGMMPEIDALDWKEGITTRELEDGRVAVYQIRKVLEAGPKSLDEAKGLAIAGYQKELEAKWIEELRAKYPVSVNKEVFNTIIEK